MSTDLDRLFTALTQDADTIPLGGAPTARHRGNQRRRTRLVAATVAVAAAVGAGLTGGPWLIRGAAAPDVATPPDAVVRLGPPRPVSVKVSFGGPATGLTAVDGKRTYVSWLKADGTLMVAAAMLSDGEPAWEPRALGRFHDNNGVYALPRALLVIGEDSQDGARVPEQRLHVLDPDKGTVRWQVGFDYNDDDLLFYDAALVLVTGDGLSRGYDWRSGRVLWEAPAGADPPVASLGTYQPDEPLPTDLYPALPPPVRGSELLQVTAAGKLVVRDAATGTVIATGNGPGPAERGDYFAYGGQLYAKIPQGDGYLLKVSNVDGAGVPRTIHTGEPGHVLVDLAPCGTGLVCLLDAADDRVRVVAVDVASGKEAWSGTAPEATRLVPAGRRILALGGEGHGSNVSALYDADGRQLLGDEDRQQPVVWLTTGTLLSLGARDLAAVDAADGGRRVLGELPPHGWYCSWTASRLVCPVETGLQMWDIQGR